MRAKRTGRQPCTCVQARPLPRLQPSAAPADQDTNRAVAYYHAALAGVYEDDAISEGQPDQITRAIEEYKTALNADPDSAQLNDELADLYFRTGRVHDAEMTAKNLLKTSPNDVDAHKLLGRIYLRQLGEGQNGVSSASPAGNVLDQAIAEFEKIVELRAPQRGRPHGSGAALHGEAPAAEGGRRVQDRAGHRAGFGRCGAEPGAALRRERRHAEVHQGD